MKYRTKKVRNKQLGIIGIVILLFVSTSSFLSLNAIRSTNTKELALKESLTSVQVKPLVPDNPAAEQTRLWVTGDSVILGIRQGLGELFPIVLINARVGRQAPELLEEITKDILLVGDAPIVFNLGNNGILKREDVFAIFEVIKNQRLIIVVNTAVPRPWREANNQLLAEVASNYQRVNIVDWANISKDHPEYFAPDGVHLVPTGATAYVQAITQFLR